MYITKATATRLIQYVISSVREDATIEKIENGNDCFGNNYYQFFIYRRGGWNRSFHISIHGWEYSRSLTIYALWYSGKYIAQRKCKSFREVKDVLEEVKKAIESV